MSLLLLNRFLIPEVTVSLKLSDADIAIVDSVITDLTEGQSDGIVDEHNDLFAPPITNYHDIIADNPEMTSLTNNAIKLLLGPAIQYLSPFTASITSIPSMSISSGASSIITTTLSSNLQIPRLALINFSFIVSSTTPTRFEYNVNVNGTPVSSHMTHVVDQANVHQCVTGQWAVTIPAGSATLSGIVTKTGSDGGILVFDQTACLSVIG